MSDGPRGPGWWQASDGRWYPPEAAPAYRVPPPARPGMNGCLVALIVVLVLGTVVGIGSCVALAIAADDVAEDVGRNLDENRADERDDVGQPRCETDEVGDMVAVMEVTNDSSKRSNYTIEVAFESPAGDQVDTGSATVSALEPGQSTEASASSFTGAPAGGFTCRVADVERFSDEG
jgi:hypothetical protein